MKKLVIILFLILPLATFAQSEVATSDVKVETVDSKNDEVKPATATKAASLKIKAEVINLNHKKSNDIISIKAYRKSLQVKVKTVKLC
ncbi:MAG: hypothetical protein KJO22_00485 [Bacteroidia bacterium]|nr:hypothetical protein [Bacteroidia bacterium]